jgi:hypothetical protein
MTFRCVVKNLDGSLMWDIPFTKFTITQELNKGELLQISFERTAIKPISDAYGVTVEFIFSASYREIEIYDEDENKIYAGYISELQFNAGANDYGNISVTSKGYFSLLEKRYTDDSLSYTSEDSADIAWALIDFTQSNGAYGDLGITRGSHPATKDRDRTDLRYKNIAEAIRGMSSSNVKEGYDFDINADKQFNIYYPKGITREELYLENDFNINSYQIIKTFIDGMTNQAIVIGSGVDETNQLIVTRDADNAYKEAFFLLQDVLNESDVSVQTTLEDKGDKYLETYQSPRITISVTTRYDSPSFPDYEVGDWLNVNIPEYDIDSTYRVNRRTCDNKGSVSLTLREY